MTDEGIYDGLIRGTPKKNLKKLYFAFLSNMTVETIFKIGVKYHGQITELDLGGTTNITDDALQMIIEHFPRMRYLNLDSCCKVFILHDSLDDERSVGEISFGDFKTFLLFIIPLT